MNKSLNKSDLMDYYFCKKNLWFIINKHSSKSPMTEGEKFRAEQGDKFEIAARKLFNNGVLIEGNDIKEKTDLTKIHIKKRTNVIFQATVESEGFTAISDVLVKTKDNMSWELYEIKSTTNIKEDNPLHKGSSNYIKDIAFQNLVCEMNGIEISSCYVIHPNKKELFSHDINNNKFFNIVDVTEKVLLEKNIVQKDMFEMKEFLAGNISSGCDCLHKGRSNQCDTFNISNPKVPDYSIHDLKSVGQSKATLSELVSNQIFEISSLPADHKILTNSRKGQFESYIQKKPIYMIDEITEELSKLKWPIQFLDFETYHSVIPIIEGYFSWEKIPFQWSLHSLNENEELKSRDFIVDSISKDPLEELADELFRNIDLEGTIVVWHESFEKGIFETISEKIPSYKNKVSRVLSNIFDLEKIFKSNMYCDYRTRGSSSLKKITPVLLDDYTYDELEINNGENAFIEWERMVMSNLSDKEKEKIRLNLIDYCNQDTLATYKILNFLRKLVNKKILEA